MKIDSDKLFQRVSEGVTRFHRDSFRKVMFSMIESLGEEKARSLIKVLDHTH